MNQLMRYGAFFSVLVLSTGTPCQAQFAESEGIQASGSGFVERLPERLRMTVTFSVSGKTLPDAMEKLKARRTKIEQQLQTLGAEKGSEKFGAPKLDNGQGNERQQMEMMMRQRMMQQARGGKLPKKESAAKPVVVSVQVTADWRLTTTNDLDLFVESQKLQDAIRAADLAGMNDAAEEKTAEEEELAEEASEMSINFGGGQTAKPGEPAFAYVIRVTAQDRNQALASAYRKALHEALELAQIAGLQLGQLRSLQASGATDSGDEAAQYRMLYGGMFGMAGRQNAAGDGGAEEAIGTGAEPIRYRLTVTAAYATK